MRPRSATMVICLTLALAALGCVAPDSQAGSPRSSERPEEPRARKSVTAAILGEPQSLSSALHGAGGRSGLKGIDAVEEMVAAALTIFDDRGVLRPQLAEAVPTTENGLWVVSPDGRMETIWRIKRGAEWHDGLPITSADLVFTARVWQDRELPFRRGAVFDLIDSIEAPDARTISIKWVKPFAEADIMFSGWLALPLPRHLLEEAYAGNKATFTQLPYWGEDFVGSGAYKVREFARGSHLVVEANDRYVLGRPIIDEIVVKFISDPNTLVANILAGTLYLTLSTVSLDQAVQVRDQWRDGKIEIVPANALSLWPELLTPNPPVIGNVFFRRALLHAIDRQQMADSLTGAGLSYVAHGVVGPHEPGYKDLEASIARYDYNPRRAIQLIQGLGYDKDADGLFRDAGNQKLTVEMRAEAQVDMRMKSMLVTADYWRRIGVGAETVAIPLQRQRDREYEATRPGFQVSSAPNTLRFVANRHSSLTPLAENNFVGSNRTRYMNPELDALIERYTTTIPQQERLGVARALVRFMTEQALVLELFYDLEAGLIGKRLDRVGTVPSASRASQAWNVHEWDMK